MYSKVMCWLALDAAIDLASALGARDRPQEWTRVGDAIHAAACERGWNAQRGCFVQSFGSDALDASALMLSIVGFLPSRDPRIVAAIAAIARELTDERGLVYCYRGGDGLEGDEGTFLMCTFWLAHAYALGDDRARAEATFTSALRCANGLGLFSEEIDSSGEPLGNFPQAFSHVGLVNAARRSRNSTRAVRDVVRRDFQRSTASAAAAGPTASSRAFSKTRVRSWP